MKCARLRHKWIEEEANESEIIKNKKCTQSIQLENDFSTGRLIYKSTTRGVRNSKSLYSNSIEIETKYKSTSINNKHFKREKEFNSLGRSPKNQLHQVPTVLSKQTPFYLCKTQTERKRNSRL